VLFLTALGNASGLGSYVGVQLGWEAAAFDPIEFWLVNTGVFIPLLVVAYVWDWEPPLMSRKLLIYSLLFVTWFLVANVFRLAPWLWDNIKLLIFWWLGGVPVIALLLTRLWKGRLAARLGAVVLALVLMSAGALDVLRSTVGPSVYQEWDSNGIAFAAQVREGTPQDAVVLIDPTWNSPIFLTGRRVFMGYDGWLFANGLPWADRAQQAKAMYAGGADAMNLLRRFGVAFIVVGPGERRDMAPNESFLKQFPVAISVGDYQLYRVTP